MKNIFDTLRQKELQLRQLERDVEALRVAARLLADDTNDAEQASTQALSQPQMMRQVLLEKNEPMHISKIVEGIKKKYNKKLRAAYLVAIIYRYKKRGKLFYKVEGKPNTFGLLEWQVRQLPLDRERAIS